MKTYYATYNDFHVIWIWEEIAGDYSNSRKYKLLSKTYNIPEKNYKKIVTSSKEDPMTQKGLPEIGDIASDYDVSTRFFWKKKLETSSVVNMHFAELL